MNTKLLNALLTIGIVYIASLLVMDWYWFVYDVLTY